MLFPLFPEPAEEGSAVEAETFHFFEVFEGDAAQGIDVLREEVAGFCQFFGRKGCPVALLRDAVEDGAEEDIVVSLLASLDLLDRVARTGKGESFPVEPVGHVRVAAVQMYAAEPIL